MLPKLLRSRAWVILGRQLEGITTTRCLSSETAAPIVRGKESFDDRKRRTQLWLKDPSWSPQELSIGRHLLEEWIEDASPASAALATKIVRRWLFEETSQTEDDVSVPANLSPNSTLYLLRDALHRVLYMWQKLEGEDRSRDASIQLVSDFHNASLIAHDNGPLSVLRPDSKAYSMLFETLAQRPDLVDTVSHAMAFMEQHGIENADGVLWNSYLNLLAKCSPFDQTAAPLAQNVLTHQMPAAPDARSWAAVLSAWTAVPNVMTVERAEAVLESMKENDVPVNTVHYNIVLDAWGRLGAGQRAESLLQRMKSRPDHVSFLAVLNGWNKSRDPSAPERATRLLESMQEHYHLRPTLQIHTTFLGTWSQRPESGPRVQKLLEQLEKENERPSLMTYAAAIRAWGKTANGIGQATDIVSRLEELGREESQMLPDTFTYTTLMQAWADSDRADAPKHALALLRRMEALSSRGRKSLAPSTVTYNVALHVLVKHGEVDLARALLAAMNNRAETIGGSARPDCISYATVIHAYTKGGRHTGKEAKLLLQDMEDRFDSGNNSLEPTPAIYASVIYAHANTPGEENAERAEGILWHLQERFRSGQSNIGPTVQVANAALRVWSQSREAMAPERAEAVLRWMKKQAENGNVEMQPNLETFNTIMRAWAYSKRRRAAERVRELHDELSENHGLKADVRSFNSWLVACKFSRTEEKIELASEIFDEMLSRSKNGSSCRPNQQSFHLLLDIFRFRHAPASDRKAAQHTLEVIAEELCRGEFEMTKSLCMKSLGIMKLYEVSDKRLVRNIVHKYAEVNEVDNDVYGVLLDLIPSEDADKLLKHLSSLRD